MDTERKDPEMGKVVEKVTSQEYVRGPETKLNVKETSKTSHWSTGHRGGP